MKMLTRLVIALVICFIAIPMIMATPVQAAGYFSLPEDEGYVGDEVSIYGSWDAAHGSYIYIYYELYNVDKDDWPYEKVRYDYAEYDGSTLTGYYFDYDFEIPESCRGAHDILICDDDDPDDDVDTLEFALHPSIEIDEEEGPAGTEVGMTGKGWDEDESEIEIRFYLKDPGTAHLDDDDYYIVAATEDIEVDEYGSWEDVTFEIPRGKKGDHWIYAVGDESDDIEDDEIRGVEFAVLPGISLDPEEGRVDDTITATGSGFGEDEEDIEILFDGQTVAKDIKADEDGCWEETFEVPEAAKGKYDVTAEGEYTEKKDIEEIEFTVKPGLILFPSEGHVDTILTVSGGGFAASKLVTITYDGIQQATSTTNSKGSFSGISFEATHTQTVHTINHPVVATDAAGNTDTTNFVMESTPPPKPTLSLPANASRVGLVGSQSPTFTWSEVTDPSGVSYKLQIATDPNFANLAIPEITGLTQASYTIPEGQALAYGTYYWRVCAVDGAKNIGEWSGAYSFKSGLLPLWASIAIGALICVLIGVLVYFFGIRRRASYD